MYWFTRRPLGRLNRYFVTILSVINSYIWTEWPHPTCLAPHSGLRAEPVASVTCCGQQVGVQQTPSPLSHFWDAFAFEQEQELWQGLSAQNFPSGIDFSGMRVTRNWYSAKVTEPNGLNTKELQMGWGNTKARLAHWQVLVRPSQFGHSEFDNCKRQSFRCFVCELLTIKNTLTNTAAGVHANRDLSEMLGC